MNVEKTIETPIGPMVLVASDDALVAACFPAGKTVRIERARGTRPAKGRHPILNTAEIQLDEYFRGARRTFSIPLLQEGTAFQRAVWDALVALPYGGRCSYSELAKQVEA